MKKEALLRGLLGVPLGIALGHIISCWPPLGLAGGEFSPLRAPPGPGHGQRSGRRGPSDRAVRPAGAAFGAGSVVWSLDHWSLVKQTGVYFLIGSWPCSPIAYLAHWMERACRASWGTS